MHDRYIVRPCRIYAKLTIIRYKVQGAGYTEKYNVQRTIYYKKICNFYYGIRSTLKFQVFQVFDELQALNLYIWHHEIDRSKR